MRTMYRRLLRAFGPQGWWPARTPFEMMVGAILTQATNWQNVEQAIARVRHARALEPRRLLRLRRRALERAIRPSGYFRQKARRLRQFTRWYVQRFEGRAERMFRTPWRRLREELVALPGIGAETADSMLLYAGRQPVFVVDAYTRRVFRRHRLIPPPARRPQAGFATVPTSGAKRPPPAARAGGGMMAKRATYADIQRLAMTRLPRRVSVYNEFHALLVAVGKRFCHRRDPNCAECPLGDLPHTVRD